MTIQSALVSGPAPIATPLAAKVHYRTVQVDGVEVFYREAGSRQTPALLLLHGFPTSSHMFRELIPRLADHYNVIAPDYPGFGYSAAPDRATFAYTFEKIADVIDKFTQAIGLERYGLYVMDYGAPIGYRLALAHPERVTSLIVQNGNAYEEGLGEFWASIRKYWQDPNSQNRDVLRVLLKPESTRWQYTNGVANASLLSPDTWTLDQAGLDRPGNDEIQLDLFYDYRTNVPLYPRFQQYFRDRQPPTLVLWGRNDAIFLAEGAMPYRRELPNAEIHLLDTGHFALETHGLEIASLIQDFLARNRER